MDRRQFLASMGTGMVLLAGCTSEGEEPAYETEKTGGSSDSGESGQELTSTTEADTEKEEEGTGEAKATVLGSELTKEEGEFSTDVYVMGEIENTGDTRLGYVEASAKFYDGEENLVDTGMSNMIDLAPDEIWEPYVSYLGSDADQIESHEMLVEYREFLSSQNLENAELVDHELEVSEDEAIVTGHVENTGDSSLDYVEARAKFYSKEGNVIGTAMTNVTDLGAGETWKFDASMILFDGMSEVDSHKAMITE